jgi:cytochrome c peroxidase
MHDGRFETLDGVIDHYSNGIDNSANLDVRLRDENGNAKRFNIPTSDKYAIIAFLNTMTDNSLLYDKKFSNPFKVR